MLARSMPLAGLRDSSGRKTVPKTMLTAIKNELLIFNIYIYMNIQEQ